MWKIIFSTALVTSLLCCKIPVTSQTMVIQKTDGTEISEDISLLQNFTLPSYSLQLLFSNQQTQSFSLADIQKIYFQNVVSAQQVDAQSDISIYPNPVSTQLYIKNIPDGGASLQLYKLDGQLVNSYNITSSEAPIDMTQMSVGMYLLKINNQGFKIIKK